MTRLLASSLLAAVAATALAGPLPAPAQTKASSEWEKKIVPIEIFGQFPSIERPELSPDGTQVATRVRVGGVQALAIIPIGEAGAKPHIIARDADFSKDMQGAREIYDWEWVDDQNLLISLRSRDFDLDQWLDVTRIAAYNTVTRKATPLGWEGAAASASDVLWKSPPGTPKPHLLLQRQSGKYGTERWFLPEVIDIDVESGKTTTVLRPNPVVHSWTADAAGVIRIGSARDRDTGKLRILYRASNEENFRTLMNDTPERYTPPCPR